MQSKTLAQAGAVVALVALIALSSFDLLGPHAVQAEKPRVVRWLIAHEPNEVFARAGEVFANALATESHGTLTLKVLTLKDVGFSGDNMPTNTIKKLMQDGTIEMSSVFTTSLGYDDQNAWVLNLPYLFNTYDEAAAAFDGPFGRSLLADVSANTPFQALAFTYSGGFRVIASNTKAIRTPNDLKGLSVATTGGPVAVDELAALGAKPVSINLGSGATETGLGDVDAVETVYTRLSLLPSNHPFTNFVTETNHNLFLTAIVADDAFFDSLSTDEKEALRSAAEKAALVERQDSIALAARTSEKLAAEGVTVIKLSSPEQEAFKKALAPVFDSYHASFAPFLESLDR